MESELLAMQNVANRGQLEADGGRALTQLKSGLMVYLSEPEVRKLIGDTSVLGLA